MNGLRIHQHHRVAWRGILLVAASLALGLTACRQVETVDYHMLLSALTNATAIASLSMPPTEMICSYDRTGANEDYNHFQGKTKDGQYILADLKGPGVLERFWFTGIPADAKFRFYFDGDRSPMMSFSWNDLVAGYAPFDTPPVSVDEQNCWHTFLPVPFRKRLLITTDDRGYTYGGSTKMYYQLNWRKLPRGQTVASLTLPMPAPYVAKLNEIAECWQNNTFGLLPEPVDAFDVPASGTVDIWNASGPATLQAFTLVPDFSSIKSALRRDALLRDVLLQIYWDGQAEPSVNVPLGDFFGSVWQRWRAESMYFGSKGDPFFCRFPMPFQESARITLVNPSEHAFAVRSGTAVGPVVEGGYFHAGWRNSPASATGLPHTVLEAEGRGRYVGCILSVVSADRTFWVLESDESMRIDGEKRWQGTGLEDYFNSGWYYGNVFARPLQGLPIKAPFRTVQYRLHPTEAVMFGKSFSMEFERGPEHKSRATYESVAFYYLDRPQAADSTLADRAAPVDTVQPYTLMTDLWNFERFGDAQGQLDYIERYREQFRPPFGQLLDLRRLAIQADTGTISPEVLADALRPFRDSTNMPERVQADALHALYTEANAVLIQFYANMPSELYLNGERILTAGDPQQPMFAIRHLTPGTHVLVAASAAQNYPPWTQVAVRDANGFLVGTDGSWKHAINPAGAWSTIGYDDSGWSGFSGYDARVKGPPEEPYVWVHPDPFVNTLSKASGLRPSLEWPDKRGRVVYRTVFEM